MNSFAKYLFIESVIVLLITFGFYILNLPASFTEVFGTTFVLSAPIVFIIGIFTALINKTKTIGLSLLLLSGLMFISGCCVCSMGSFNI